MKRLLSLLSLLVISVSLFAEDFVVDGIKYRTTSSNTVQVVSNNYSGDIVIPETVVNNNINYSVTSIGEYAFYFCSGLTSVTIGNSVKSIGEDAFQSCSGLTSVTIGNSVTSIGIGAFSSCRGLISVTIPNSVTSLGDWVFDKCSSLTSVTIGNSVTSIGKGVFYGCGRLTSVTLGRSVTSISENAFEYCTIDTLITLSEEPPLLGSVINTHKLEVPIGHIADYVKTEKWNNIDTIYAVKDNEMYVGVICLNDGEPIIQIGNWNSQEVEVKVNTPIGIKLKSGISDGYQVIHNNKIITEQLNNGGEYSFSSSLNWKNNIIKTYSYPTTIVEVPGTLLDHIGIDNIENISSLRVRGDINGTDILVIRKMTNLKTLDLENANIVNGGSSYYQNYVTSKDAIGDYFFKDKENLVNIILPLSITTIKSYAFSGCKNLVSITIPSKVEYVGNQVFEGCENLIYAKIQCPKIGNWFQNSKSLREVVIGDETIKIEDKAFYHCENLGKVKIGNSVETIGKEAFAFCALQRIEIPSSVTYIGENAFASPTLREFYICDDASELTLNWPQFRTEYLKEVYIGRNLKDDSRSPWQTVSTIDKITFGSFVTKISDYAFMDCNNITSMIIGKSVTTIGYKAFYKCENLVKVELPNSLVDIGEYAFSGCKNLTTVLGNNDGSLSSIGKYAFYKCENLLSCDNILNGIKVINYACFSGCNSLTSVVIPNSVEQIGSNAFSNCKNLSTVIFGSKVTSIGGAAFGSCSSLNNVNLPISLTSLESYAFEDCDSLTSISIPNGITKLDEGVFEDCASLAQVNLGNGVTIIGYKAFNNCSGLTNISFPENVKTIEREAFKGCTSLKSLHIPRNLDKIMDGAFDDCTGLESLVFEDSKNPLTFVTDGATAYFSMTFFANCGVREAYMGRDFVFGRYGENNFVGYGVQSIAPPFYSQKKLVKVTIGNNVTRITRDAFKGCSELKAIVIPDSVKTVGEQAFNGCEKLSSVRIGKSVTSIGSRAFQGCKEIVDVTSLNSTPPSINENTFEEETYSKAVLYVPKGNINIYWLHPYWEKFAKMQEIEVSDVKTIKTDDNIGIGNGKVYNLNGTKVDGNSLSKGIYIKNGKKVIIK